jgi:hypothetical protein
LAYQTQDRIRQKFNHIIRAVGLVTTPKQYAFLGFTDNRYYTSDRYIKLDSNWTRADGKPLKGIGFEIELHSVAIAEDYVLANVLKQCVLNKLPDGLFKMQDDCTLGGNSGAECITQVMTKEFIRNHYADWKSFWEACKMFDITADNGCCGMHANLSLGLFGTSKKAQDEAIRKLYYIINKHYDFFKVALHRNGQTTWCGQMDYSCAKTMNLETMSSSHNNCLNYSHYNVGRIEIRLVGGQKNYACFRNTCEMLFFLIDRVKEITWKDCDHLTKIFKGCNSYVFDRIKDNCLSASVITRTEVETIRESVISVHYL